MDGESFFDSRSLADYTNIQRFLQFPADQPPNLTAAAANYSTGRSPAPASSRYESQKRRDWNTFGQYLKNHRPPLALAKCSGAHVLEFLRYLDKFGKTKVHVQGCPYFGQPQPAMACACPLRQAWGSLDALIGRLRAAFEENGGRPESNPFGVCAVRLYLREVRETQGKARGIAYQKKKRRRPPAALPDAADCSALSPSTAPVATNTTSAAPSSPPHLLHQPDHHRQQQASAAGLTSYGYLSTSLHNMMVDEDGCLPLRFPIGSFGPGSVPSYSTCGHSQP